MTREAWTQHVDRREGAPTVAKPSKYRNQRTMVDGLVFDSMKEARRYRSLRQAEHVGFIVQLDVHPRYELHAPNGETIGRFTPDFRYVVANTGEVIIEDVKSPITRKETAYRLRKRMVEAEYGITVQEI